MVRRVFFQWFDYAVLAPESGGIMSLSLAEQMGRQTFQNSPISSQESILQGLLDVALGK